MVLGSEGRLGVLTRVTVRISPIPERDDIYGIFFPSWDHAVIAVRTIAGAGIPYSMIRLSNPVETRTGLAMAGHSKKMGLLSRYLRIRGVAEDSACLCLIGFTGSKRQVRPARREAVAVLQRYKGVSAGKAPGAAWKKNRFRAPYLRNTLWNIGYAVDTLETAVTWDKVDTAMETIEQAVEESLVPWNEKIYCFSHLSHVYPSGSSIYTTVVFRLANTPEETLARWQAIKEAASRAIIRAGGTISHQHGIGVDHLPYMADEKGSAGTGALKQLCAYFDPENRMNPGKLVM